MPLFGSAEEHAANPPESWEVAKVHDAPPIWHLRPKGAEYPLESYSTKKAAEADRVEGHWVREYHRDSDWYAGKPQPGIKPHPNPRPDLFHDRRGERDA